MCASEFVKYYILTYRVKDLATSYATVVAVNLDRDRRTCFEKFAKLILISISPLSLIIFFCSNVVLLKF